MASTKALYFVLVLTSALFIDNTDAISLKFWKWGSNSEATNTSITIVPPTPKNESGTEILIDLPSSKPWKPESGEHGHQNSERDPFGVQEPSEQRPVFSSQGIVKYPGSLASSASSPINVQQPSLGIPIRQKPASSVHPAPNQQGQLPILQTNQQISSNPISQKPQPTTWDSASVQSVQDSALNQYEKFPILQNHHHHHHHQQFPSNPVSQKPQKITWDSASVQSAEDSVLNQHEKFPILQTHHHHQQFPSNPISQKPQEITLGSASVQSVEDSVLNQHEKFPILQTHFHLRFPSNPVSQKPQKITWDSASVQSTKDSVLNQHEKFPILQTHQQISMKPNSEKPQTITWDSASVQSVKDSTPNQHEKFPILQTHHQQFISKPNSQKYQETTWDRTSVQSVKDFAPNQHVHSPGLQTHSEIQETTVWYVAPATQTGSNQQYPASSNSQSGLGGNKWQEETGVGSKGHPSTSRPTSTTDSFLFGESGIKSRPEHVTDEKLGVVPNNKAVYSSNPTYSEGNQVTDEDLEKLFESLFMKDSNNVNRYIRTNVQKRTTGGNPRDEAPEPLFTVDSKAFQIPTVQKILSIYDNYNLDSRVNESISSVQRKEEDLLIDTFLSTDVMAAAMRFLANKGYIARDYYAYKDKLRQIWFKLYPRGEVQIGSSGFEHVFMAELKQGTEVSGLHNWIYFSEEEIKGRANYLGYTKKVGLGDKAAILKIHARFENIDKPVTTMFVGTSPELEMALYTVCFIVRSDQKCPVSLGDTKLDIITYKLHHHGVDVIETAYPHF